MVYGRLKDAFTWAIRYTRYSVYCSLYVLGCWHAFYSMHSVSQISQGALLSDAVYSNSTGRFHLYTCILKTCNIYQNNIALCDSCLTWLSYHNSILLNFASWKKLHSSECPLQSTTGSFDGNINQEPKKGKTGYVLYIIWKRKSWNLIWKKSLALYYL